MSIFKIQRKVAISPHTEQKFLTFALGPENNLSQNNFMSTSSSPESLHYHCYPHLRRQTMDSWIWSSGPLTQLSLIHCMSIPEPWDSLFPPPPSGKILDPRLWELDSASHLKDIPLYSPGKARTQTALIPGCYSQCGMLFLFPPLNEAGVSGGGFWTRVLNS